MGEPWDKSLGFARSDPRSAKKEVGQRGASADPMVTHHEDSRFPVLRGALVEAKGTTVEPAWARLLVVVGAEPEVLELADLGVVLVPSKIDDVGDA